VGRDVLVRLLGLLEQPPTFGGVAVLPEGEQGLGAGPGSRTFVGILLAALARKGAERFRQEA
jgi:hypothetical protein